MVPNLFVVGAPKCGTSSLHSWLGQHSQVYMCDPKEPKFWATDFPHATDNVVVPMKTKDHYLGLFGNTTDSHRYAGESSALYLYSSAAVNNILEFNPHSKLIACVRNPLDLIPSFHEQLIYGAIESEPELEKAWQLQTERRNGTHIPAPCVVPEVLQYREVAMLGHQIQRFVARVPEEQRLVLIFDDLKKSPKECLSQVLRFLELDEEPIDLKAQNRGKQHRFPWLSNFVMNPPKLVRPAVNWLRLHGQSPWLRGLKNFTRKPSQRAAISPEFKTMLASEYRDDVGLLSDLLKRDLSSWLVA